MHHGFDLILAHRPREQFAIAQLAADQRQSQSSASVAVDQIVIDPHSMPLAREQSRGMRTDITGATSNQNVHVKP